MGFEYVDVQEGIERDGLRMVVVGGVPSPWGEAAKGILHMKGIDWTAVRLVYDSPAFDAWAGQQSGPIAIYDDELPVSGWDDILLLAERLAPQPALVPEDPELRHQLFELGHEILGEHGLCWQRRLQLVHASLTEQRGFPGKVAHFLAAKYGYDESVGEASTELAAALLTLLASHLKKQQAAGNHYYLGELPTALDIYSAVAVNMFAPLPPEHCAMHERTRAAFEVEYPATSEALDAILIEHRDRMYSEHLELPLSL